MDHASDALNCSAHVARLKKIADHGFGGSFTCEFLNAGVVVK